MDDDLLAAIEVETCRLASARNDAVMTLRMLEEARARQLLGIVADEQGQPSLPEGLDLRVRAGLDPQTARAALTHLRAAEVWQWEIGTWSTSAGEGFASMSEVYALKLGQAWLHDVLGEPERAIALVDEVERCPNSLGGFWSQEIARLRAHLGV